MDQRNTYMEYEERPQFRSQRSWKVPFLIVLTVGVTLVMIVTMGMVKSYMDFQAEEAKLAVFKPFVSSYIEAAEDESLVEEFEQRESDEDAHLVGLLVVVHAEAGAVYGWAHKQIGEEYCARMPDEVGTVAVLRPEWKRIGDYVDTETGKKTQGAYQGFVHVTLLRWMGQKIIARKSFVGSEPRKHIPKDGSASGGLPMRDAVNWLKELTRR